MKNKISFLAFSSLFTAFSTTALAFFCVTTAVFAQKNSNINSNINDNINNDAARYVSPEYIGPALNSALIDGSVSASGEGSANATALDTITPFLRISEFTEDSVHYAWHLPNIAITANTSFILRKNNVIVYTATLTPQTVLPVTKLSIPLSGIHANDVLRATIRRGGVQKELKAMYILSLNASSLSSGNSPLPMATVETVHPRRRSVRVTGSNVVGQCFYMHDGENNSAAYYRSNDVLPAIDAATMLTDSTFGAAISSKMAYITLDYNYGNCNSDSNNMRAETVIGQVFPNPTEDAFTLQYTVDYTNDVSVKIVDMQGQELYNYSKKGETQGTHQLVINDLPKGIYIYFLQKGSQIQRGTLVKK